MASELLTTKPPAGALSLCLVSQGLGLFMACCCQQPSGSHLSGEPEAQNTIPLPVQYWLCPEAFCTDVPTWLLWTGKGQKAKHKLSSSLFFVVFDQNCLTCAFLHGLREGADILEGRDHPWVGGAAFCGVSVCYCCCHVLKGGSSLHGAMFVPLYCCSVNKDLPLCIEGAVASTGRAGRNVWQVLEAKSTAFMQTLQGQENNFPFSGVQHSSCLGVCASCCSA